MLYERGELKNVKCRGIRVAEGNHFAQALF
jgi:hypothetical protein